MNNSYASASQNQGYQCYGSLALQPSEEQPRLRVFQGGCTGDASSSVQERELRSRVRGLIIVAAMVCAVSLAGIGISGAAQSSQRNEALGQAQVATVSVASGDTVWSIAESHPVQGVSTSDLVQWISERNGLGGSPLSVGQQLQIPVSHN
jgi:hypothetical protein